DAALDRAASLPLPWGSFSLLSNASSNAARRRAEAAPLAPSKFERQLLSVASIRQSYRLRTAFEGGQLGRSEVGRSSGHFADETVVEEHHREAEQRLVPREVAVPEAIDRDRQVPCEQ